MLLNQVLHCNTLQHTATHCNTLQHTAMHCNTLQHTAHALQRNANTNVIESGVTLQQPATYCNTLQHTATHCNTLQHTATHCKYKHICIRVTLQHTATPCNTTAMHYNTRDYTITRDFTRLSSISTTPLTATHCNEHCNTLQRNCNTLYHT